MPASQDRETPPHQRFVAALQDLDGVLWEMDASTWRFTFVSERAERMFGYELSRWYDEPTFWQDHLLHPEDQTWCTDYCSTACRDCQDHAFLYRARCADGSVKWIKDVVRVIPGADGAPSVMRGIMVDATDEMADQLEPSGAIDLDYNQPDLADLRRRLVA